MLNVCKRWSSVLALMMFAGLLTGCSHLPLLSKRASDKLSSFKPREAANDEPATSTSRTPENDANVLLTLARNHELRGNLDLAIHGYRKAIEKDDGQALPFYRLALLHDKRGDGKAARGFYREALTRAPDSPEIYCNLGYSCYLQGLWQDSEENLRKAIALRPDFDRARNNLALVLARTGRPNEAIHELAATNASEGDARANLALAHMLNGDVDAAREQLQLAKRLQPSGSGDNLASLRRIAASSNSSSRPARDLVIKPRRLPPEQQVLTTSGKSDNDPNVVRASHAIQSAD